MKRKIFILTLMCVLIIGCRGNTSKNSNNTSNNSISSSDLFSSNILNNEKLVTPSLSLDQFTGIVSWNFISNADYYSYIIDGYEGITMTNHITLNDGQTIVVRAESNNESYENSELSNPITYYEVDTKIVTIGQSVVYFHDTNFSPVTVNNGFTIAYPENPTKPNHIFENWYADIFHTELFNFSKPINGKTIVYASYTPTELVNSVYYWIKADSKMTSNVQSSSASWRHIPLIRNYKQIDYHEFKVSVTISGASTTTPCEFVITDGLDPTPNRLYWKRADKNFIIDSDGIYNIYFAAEYQWNSSDGAINIYIDKVSSSGEQSSNKNTVKRLTAPKLSISNGLVTWSMVPKASKYAYIINNGALQYTNNTSILIDKKDFITIMAISNSTDYLDSYWSTSMINYEISYNEQTDSEFVHLYFFESNLPSQKIRSGEKISQPSDPIKQGYTFVEWCSDITRLYKFNFNESIIKNIIIYPKWVANDDWRTTEYFHIYVDGNKTTAMLLNQSCFDYNEHKAVISVTKTTTFVVKDKEQVKEYGPYTISEAGIYTIYFSDEHLWGNEHIYIARNDCNIYFTNTLNWSKVYAYYYNSSGNYAKSWPGNEMEYVKTNNYNQKIFRIIIDVSVYETLIFNNNSSSMQTIDINLVGLKNNQGYYAKETKVGNAYECGTWTYS